MYIVVQLSTTMHWGSVRWREFSLNVLNVENQAVWVYGGKLLHGTKP